MGETIPAPYALPAGFGAHRWIADDAGRQCFRCGIYAPSDDAASDLMPPCPGPDATGELPAHVLTLVPAYRGDRVEWPLMLECAVCSNVAIDAYTVPSTILWGCRG